MLVPALSSYRGSTSAGTVDLPAFDDDYSAVSFSLSNTSGSNCGVTLYVSNGIVADTAVTAFNFTLKPGQCYNRECSLDIKTGDFLRLVVTGSGSLDYYFSIM